MQQTQTQTQTKFSIIAPNVSMPNTKSYYRSRAHKPLVSINPLVGSASQILYYLHQIKLGRTPQNIHDLYQILVHEINVFGTQCKNCDYPNETILLARYILCAAIDEILLHQSPATSKTWALHTLVSTFYNKTESEHNSFFFLEKLLEEPKQHIDLLELFYLCLRAGFQGEYRKTLSKNADLTHLTDDLYKIIRKEKMGMKKIPPPPKKLPENKSPAFPIKNLFKQFGTAVLVVLCVYTVFNVIFNQIVKPVETNINFVKNLDYASKLKQNHS